MTDEFNAFVDLALEVKHRDPVDRKEALAALQKEADANFLGLFK